MILLPSKRLEELVSARKESIGGEDTKAWQRLVRHEKTRFADPFLALFEDGVPAIEVDGIDSHASFSEWLPHANQWAQRNVLEPRAAVTHAEYVFYVAWEGFMEKLREALRVGRQSGQVPGQGGVLAFIGGLQHCVIVDFAFQGAVPDLRVVGAIESPMSVFDFWGAIDNADVSARNHLKRILASGDKLVWIRNTLVHVDRRHDAGVFGPSIDTLVLVELLGQLVLDQDLEVETVLEVGCGNGLIASTIAGGVKDLNEFFGIDTDSTAIECTNRNVSCSFQLSRRPPPALYLTIGSFQRRLFDRVFDLIVCNPPYIPERPGRSGKADGVYFEAIAGTALLEAVMEASVSLLAPKGVLLLMVSSLCLEEAMLSVPAELSVSRPLGDKGFTVLFDVEAVVEDEKWLTHLLDGNGLFRKGEFYYHDLHPFVVERRV